MIAEEEVQAITDFLRLQGEPVYNETSSRPQQQDEGEHEPEDAEQDVMYDDS